MKVVQLGISGAVLILLASCSVLGSNGKRIDYGAATTQVPVLEVPPDLTTPGIDDRYKVPQGGAGAAATFSDYSKGGTAQGNVASAVLPEVQGVHMARNDVQRWLVVNDRAENVWPVVEGFWKDLGLTFSSEDPAAGVMETAWAENRAKKLPGGSSGGINQEFSNAHAAGERDQYQTRLERSKDGASTEIYITHRGIKQEFSPAKGTTQWVARPYDPELEAIMLQQLMVRFGISEAKAASAVASASPPTTTSLVAAGTALNSPDPVGMSTLREISAGNTVIVVNDTFDRAWRKIGLAIEGAGLAVEDKDREKGIYYLRPIKLESDLLDKLKFWKSNKDTTSHYRVNVKDGGKSCEVTIIDQDGVSNKVSKQMLEAIYKNINQ